MSGAFPASPAPNRIKLISVAPNFVSVTHSLKRQVRSRGVQRWQFNVEYAPLRRTKFMPLFAFAVAQRGQFETFTFIPVTLAKPQGIATGTPVVAGASQTGRAINTSGWTVSTTGILKAGDVLKFAGHNKVYMQTVDADSDVSGNVTLTIEPALEESPADLEAITVNNVPFTVSFTGDNQEADTAPGVDHLYGYVMTLTENP